MKRIVALTLGFLMIFSLTACSNKGDGPKKDVSAPEVQDYNIAVCIPITGTNATYAAYIKNGLEMALANLEKRGGLNGTGGKIILDFYDDCNDPKQGVALAERIVEDDKYLCEIGSFASPVSLAAAPIYNEVEMVQYALTSSNTRYLPIGKYCFSLSTTQDVSTTNHADWQVNYLGYKTFAVIHSNDDWGNESFDFYKKAIEAEGGTIIAEESYIAGSTNDFTAMLTTLKTINADAVMTFCGEDDLVMMIKQADMLGIDFNWLSSKKCCSATVIDQLGELAEGLYSLNNALKSKENKVYADYYEEYIKVYPSSETTQKYVDQSYNCMLTVIWAIENGGVDRLSFRDKLASLSNFMGVQGTISFDPDTRKVFNEEYLAQVQNGVWVNIDTSK